MHKLIRTDHLQCTRDLMDGIVRHKTHSDAACQKATVHALIAACERLDAILGILQHQFGPSSAAELIQHKEYLETTYP